MIGWHLEGPREMDSARRPDGNETDLRYLEDTAAALGPILAAAATAAAAAGTEVRIVAGTSLVEHGARHAAITALLHDWGRSVHHDLPATPAEALAGLRGDALEEVFLVRLAAHAHASTADARMEMIAGASRSARALAEQAIHADDRRLATLAALLAARRRDTTPPTAS